MCLLQGALRAARGAPQNPAAHGRHAGRRTAAGAPAPKGDGLSLLPLFAGKAAPSRTLHWEHYNYNAKTRTLTPQGAALRSGQWKAVLPEGAPLPELYDLSVDEAESHDLAPTNPRLARRFASAIRQTHTPPLPHTGIMDWVR
jgi:hypothetical protein